MDFGVKMPSKSLYKETMSDSGRVYPCKRPESGRVKRFAILPGDVLRSRELSPADKLVFAGLALQAVKTDVVAVSHPAMATICGISRSQVCASVKTLERFGLIMADGGRVKQVQPYRILHPKFGENQQESTAVVEPRTERTLLTCAKCRRITRGLASMGWCRGCVRDSELEISMRRAIQVLGSTATVREIAGYLQVEKLSRRLVRFARKLGVAA